RNEITGGCTQTYCAKGRSKFFWYPSTGDPPAHYTPTAWFDGVNDITGVWTSIPYTQSQYKAAVDVRRAVPSPLELSIDVEHDAKSDSGTIHVQVVATDTVPHTKLHIRIALVEDSLFQGGDKYDQILRDYLPTYLGWMFSTISEGDTVEHSEDFTMDPGWDQSKMRVVAYVQNGKGTPPGEYEILQALQVPMYEPTPAAVAGLTSALLESDIVLQWSPVDQDEGGLPLTVDHYVVYRDTLSFFGPGSDPFDTTVDTSYTDDTGVVGDSGTNYYYTVTAVKGTKVSDFSGAAGEFDRYVTNTEK
ncbi:Omp28-related outer membrane protein, partial [Candidatus Zixiibacteriota bacterium]